jgi:hypothetical protein
MGTTGIACVCHARFVPPGICTPVRTRKNLVHDTCVIANFVCFLRSSVVVIFFYFTFRTLSQYYRRVCAFVNFTHCLWHHHTIINGSAPSFPCPLIFVTVNILFVNRNTVIFKHCHVQVKRPPPLSPFRFFVNNQAMLTLYSQFLLLFVENVFLLHLTKSNVAVLSVLKSSHCRVYRPPYIDEFPPLNPLPTGSHEYIYFLNIYFITKQCF